MDGSVLGATLVAGNKLGILEGTVDEVICCDLIALRAA
jgi:hypothetical protein